MRLIDADNIKAKILAYWGCDPSYYEGTEADRDAYILSRLEITPTIEAIPISFLYEYMALCESVGAYQSKEAIECLIDDWREERGEKDDETGR